MTLWILVPGVYYSKSRVGFIGGAGLKGFVNGVLRTISREKDKFRWPEEEKVFFSVYYSMPEWIVERFLKDYGSERTKRMLTAYQTQRPLTIRVCEGNDAALLANAWEGQGASVSDSLR